MPEVDDTAGGVIAFATGFNAPGKVDATGAFQPRARAFAQVHGSTAVLFDDRRKMHERGAEILRHLDAYSGRPLICVAFFCHGWWRGIEAGFDMRPGVGMSPRVLAQAIASKSGEGVIVPLYACSTADAPGGEDLGGDGGFADALRDELAIAGCVNVRVDAHDRDGHTTRNPYVWRFDGNGERAAGAGGAWLVPPTIGMGGEKKPNPMWPIWKRALADGSGLDLTYPFLGRPAIAEELSRRIASR